MGILYCSSIFLIHAYRAMILLLNFDSNLWLFNQSHLNNNYYNWYMNMNMHFTRILYFTLKLHYVGNLFSISITQGSYWNYTIFYLCRSLRNRVIIQSGQKNPKMKLWVAFSRKIVNWIIPHTLQSFYFWRTKIDPINFFW